MQGKEAVLSSISQRRKGKKKQIFPEGEKIPFFPPPEKKRKKKESAATNAREREKKDEATSQSRFAFFRRH